MRGEPLRCPNDGARLVEIERSDVLIDACPECRGVWLDRGELDKILVKERQLQAGADEDFFAEMSGRGAPPQQRPQQPQPPQQHGDGHYEQPRKKKRRSLLEELLDFD
jgi:Zn-finger nucleic acid-binding protein